jgi:hypothetical protein
MVCRTAMVAIFAALASASVAHAAPVTRVFTYTGDVQSLQLPEGVGTISVLADGAAGGDGMSLGAGGLGGRVSAQMEVPDGGLLYVVVGGRGVKGVGGQTVLGGFNGGGTGDNAGGSGGGASDVRLGWPGAPDSLNSRLIVASGGGGSAGGVPNFLPIPAGGIGGAGATPDAGGDGIGSAASGGHGGTATAGGAAGTGVGIPKTAGTFGTGGNGGGHAGGGGGGWYGGGGGSNENPQAGGGGAGSSFVTAFGRAGAVQFGTATVPDASVRITYNAPEASLSDGALAFPAQSAGTAGVAQRVTLTASGAAPLAFRGARASADFLLSDDCPALIAAGASCAIDVRFAPQATGDRSSMLTLDTSAGPLTVSLSGAGTSAPVGAQGPPGPPGPVVTAARKVALTACVKSRCRTRKISGADKLAVAGTATLKRGRKVLARGHARDGLLRLTSAKALAKGRYTLTVTGLDSNGKPRTQSATVRIG